MGRSPIPKPTISRSVDYRQCICKNCTHFIQKWKNEYSEWSYCEYWHRDVKEKDSCMQFHDKV